MQRLLVVWLVGFGAWGAEAWGQRQITEEEFLGRLTPEHAAVAQARADIGNAGAERLRVAVVEDPQFGFVREDLGDAGTESVLSLAWTAPLDGRRGLGIEAAEAGIAAAEANQRAALFETRASMRQAYASWLVSSDRATLLKANLGRLEEVVRSISARAGKGEESALAASRIQLSAIEVRNLLGVVEAERVRAVAAVRVWDPTIGDADRPVAPVLSELSVEPTTDAREDLRALSLELEQAVLEERRSHRFVRFPQLLAGWKELETPDESFDGLVVGLTWDIPIADRGRSDRRRSEAQRLAAEGALDFASARARAEVEGAKRAYAELLRAWRTSHAVVSDSAWMADAAVARYRSGEDTLTDLLDTLRSVLLAQLADTAMYSRALEAHRLLELTIGGTV